MSRVKPVPNWACFLQEPATSCPELALGLHIPAMPQNIRRIMVLLRCAVEPRGQEPADSRRAPAGCWAGTSGFLLWLWCTASGLRAAGCGIRRLEPGGQSRMVETGRGGYPRTSSGLWILDTRSCLGRVVPPRTQSTESRGSHTKYLILCKSPHYNS